jgi:hypothetical protein
MTNPDDVVPLTPATASVSIVPPVPLPPVFAFLVPAPSGQVGVGGFVFDIDNLPEPHTLVIDWHDGTGTTLVLPPTGGVFSFFGPQTHKKHRHRTITVYVVDQQVLVLLAALGGFIPHFDVRT